MGKGKSQSTRPAVAVAQERRGEPSAALYHTLGMEAPGEHAGQSASDNAYDARFEAAVRAVTQLAERDPQWQQALADGLLRIPGRKYGTERRLAMERPATSDGLVRDFMSQWNGTATQQPDSFALQLAANRVFGLHANTSHLTEGDRELATEGRALLKRYSAGFDSYVRAQYAATQQYLAAHGIKELTVYRGMSYNDFGRDRWGYAIPKPPADLAIDGQPHERNMHLQPLSSFTFSPETASGFTMTNFAEITGASTEEHGNIGAIVVERVPASRIFSVPATGIGASSEQELVVLGGNRRMHVVAWRSSALHRKADIFAALQRAVQSPPTSE